LDRIYRVAQKGPSFNLSILELWIYSNGFNIPIINHRIQKLVILQ